MLMTSLMTAVYTDDPNQVHGCKDCLELVAQDLADENDSRRHCLHCRREISAQGGVPVAPDGPEALPAMREGRMVTNSRALSLALSKTPAARGSTSSPARTDDTKTHHRTVPVS